MHGSLAFGFSLFAAGRGEDRSASIAGRFFTEKLSSATLDRCMPL